MKLFWCEQSGLLEDRGLLAQTLQERGHSFHRYNWRHGEQDRWANVFSRSRLSWSLGRELLGQKILGQAADEDYVVFADDDVVFVDGIEPAIVEIEAVLGEYSVMYGALMSNNWHFTPALRRMAASQRVMRIFCADMEVQILNVGYLRRMLPALFDGGWGSLWYLAMISYRIEPQNTLCLCRVRIRNARANQTGQYGGVLNQSTRKIWEACRPACPPIATIVARRWSPNTSIRMMNHIACAKGAVLGVGRRADERQHQYDAARQMWETLRAQDRANTIRTIHGAP